MIGVLIVTHAPLAIGLIESSKMIMGDDIPNCTSLTLTLGVDMELFEEQFLSSLDSVDEGDGVIVLVDLFAGTPANVAMRQLRDKRFELVSGVNLGMLLEVLSAREFQTLEELKETALTAGKETIIDISGKVKGQ